MKILDFVRHGLSRDLVDDIRSRPNTPLVDRGREQARNIGRAMARQGIMPDLILSSPLPRSLETAEIIAEEICYTPKDILTNQELVERDWGEYTGKPNKWILTQIGTDPDAFDGVPGAETIEQLQARAARVYDEIRSQKQGHILIVGHAQFGRALRCHIAGRPPSIEYFSKCQRFETGELTRLYPSQGQDC